LRIERSLVARAVSPEQVAEVKAIACELPATPGLPLGRFTRSELHRLVVERGVTDASAWTIWRWLHDDALKPWQQRSWIFVRDPAFRERAGRVLGLYQRRFEGRRLRPDDLVICADEKSQLQALGRRHETVAARPGRPSLVEFEYRRRGTLADLAAWDVHHASLFDRVEPKTGIEPFGAACRAGHDQRALRLGAHRLLDRGQRFKPRRACLDRAARGRLAEPTARPPPDPRLWLNQIELYFSIVQRKALSPNSFDSLDELADRLLRFGEHYRQIARPFDWTFTRADLERVLAKITEREPRLALAA
jgi:hypothetical protein